VSTLAANPSSLLFRSNFGSALDSNAVGAVVPPLTITEDGLATIGRPLRGLPEGVQHGMVLGLMVTDELTGVMFVRHGCPLSLVVLVVTAAEQA
jgi:hypothetical protein